MVKGFISHFTKRRIYPFNSKEAACQEYVIYHPLLILRVLCEKCIMSHKALYGK